MKIRLVFYTIIISLITFYYSALVFGEDKNQTTQQKNTVNLKYIPNQIVVKFKESSILKKTTSGISSVDRVLKKYKVIELEPLIKNKMILNKINSTTSIENVYFVHFEGNQSPNDIANELNQNPNILYAEPLYYHKISETPNDPLFSNQGYLDPINVTEAWDIVKSDRNVVVAIVDGGTDINHEDLKANLWVNPDEIPNNNIDDDDNGFIDDIHGWNFLSGNNDPTGSPNTPINADHGTQTAGLACAVTNNSIGISGTSWNAKLMAINASATSDNNIQYGLRGITYAVNEGADIISLSWGNDSFSQAEQDVITFAIESGAAIVAAAGNDNINDPHYPSSYKDAFSVAAISTGGIKAGFSNYGPTIDAAAPGIGILSTSNNSEYSSDNGTSYSAPIVAGVMALVKTQHPSWAGIQVAEQVRVTADNIDLLNPNYVGQLGNGRINAFRAVTDSTLPSIRIADINFVDENNNGIIQRRENVELTINFFNYLKSEINIDVKLKENDPYIFLLNENSSIPIIETMQSAQLSIPLSFQVPVNTPRNHKVEFEVELSAGNYKDFDSFNLTVLPNFTNIYPNNISTSLTNNGRIGFSDTDNQSGGIGFSYKGESNLLFEGAIIAGTSANQISNAARGSQKNNIISYDNDFLVADNGEIQVLPGNVSDLESITIFDDSQSSNPMDIRIKQESFSWNSSNYKNFIILRYNIENYGSENLDNFHFGILFDWDMDGTTYGTNRADFDSKRNLGYAYNSSEEDGPDTYVGISLLSEGDINYKAIFNDNNHADNPSWGLYDGFEDSEKWEAISSGLLNTNSGPADISHVLASGPHTIQSQQSVQIGFALVAGDNLLTIQTAADSAKSLYDRVIRTTDPNIPPLKFELTQNYPNPFKPIENPTVIQYSIIDASDVELSIYNLLGQKVRTLVQKIQEAKTYTYQWNGSDDLGNLVPSGIYFYRLTTFELTKTKKLLLVR